MPRLPSVSGSLLVFGLIGLSAIMYLRLNVDSISTRYVAEKLDEILQGTEFSGDIGEVVFKPGSGFEVHNFKLMHRSTRGELLSIDRVFIAMRTGAKELAQLEIEPDLIEVYRARLSINQADLNSLRMKELFRWLQLETNENQNVPIRIRNSAIRLHDNGRAVTSFSNVAIDVENEAAHSSVPSSKRNLLKIQAVADGEHLKRIKLSVNFEPESCKFELMGGEAQGILSKTIIDALPIDLRFKGQPAFDSKTTLSGTWRCSGTASGDLNDLAKTKFGANLTVEALNLNGDHLPATVRNCNATIQVSDRSVHLKQATGQLDDGTFELTYKQSGFMQRRDWSLLGSCSNLKFSKRWLSVLPDSTKKFCRDYRPAGLFDAQFELGSGGKKDIAAQLKDTSFSYHRFPYPARNCIGNLRWIADRLTYNVQTLENGQLLEIAGHIDNPGEFATYVCNFGTEGRLPIDEQLQRTLVNYPDIDRAVRDFRLRGFVSGNGTIEKLSPGPNGKIQKQVTINLHNCDVRHRTFDYPIQRVDGTVRVVEESFRFEDVTGVSATGHVICNGDWNKRDGLRLVFLCNGVPFDARLRHALAPNLRSIWDSLRPAGAIKLGKVYLNYLPGTGVPDIRVQARLGGPNNGPLDSSVSINPVWFPYEINNLQGDVVVGGGAITMKDIRGKHEGTWMTCAGEGNYNDAQWSVRLFNLLAGSVALDQKLLGALPGELATALEDLQFKGRFNAGGEITFGGKYVADYQAEKTKKYPVQNVSYEQQTEQNTNIDWNLRFDMEQASMLVGLPVENIFGSLFLDGNYNGKTAKTSGRVAFDSLTIHGAQVTNVNGPIWIDNKQTLAGKFADPNGQQSNSILGTIYDGKVSFDGWLSHEESLPFFVQATVEESELDDAAAELAPQMEDMSGDAFGFIRLRGNAEELHTYQGDGNIHLRNARIHQLPVMISLLKILRIKEVNRTAFDSSDVDFTINGDQIKLSRIELIGDAISLIGNGYLEWMRYADVNFYSVVGRNRFHIPVVSNLYKAGCQRIMWINVGGPIDNLQTSRKVLPGLNDSIKALFQSSRTANAGSAGAAPLSNRR